MKLSEAMILGAATCRMVAGDINSCALGAALNAVGKPMDGALLQTLLFKDARGFVLDVKCADREGMLRELWPWMFEETPSPRALDWVSYGAVIAGLFDNSVVEGRMTLERLADAVAAVEPECGECCEFECSCAVAAAQ
jgi:hypothetical protein